MPAARSKARTHARAYVGDRHDRFRTDIRWKDQRDATVQVLGGLVPCLRDLGVRIALETHADLTVDELVDVLERVDHDVVGVTLDTGNLVMRLDEPVAAAERLAPRVLVTHVKDAVLALVVVKALVGSPWGTFTVFCTIPIALLMGVYARFIRVGRIGEMSAIGVVLLLVTLIDLPVAVTIPSSMPMGSGAPLGGIGTGFIEIRADGCFHEWQIFNAGPWGRNARSTTVAPGRGRSLAHGALGAARHGHRKEKDRRRHQPGERPEASREELHSM